MKTKGIVLASIMLTGMIFFAAQPALAGCEVASLDDLIAANANAPGTKYEGPLTIYFQEVTDCDGNTTTNMYLFLRLRKGWMPYVFGDMIAGIDDITFRNDPTVVESFFYDTVMPGLYPDLCPGDFCPNAVLKAYTLDVTPSNDPGDGNGLTFYITDIVLAVQD